MAIFSSRTRTLTRDAVADVSETDEVGDGVLGKQLPQLLVELSCQRLVVGNDQRRPLGGVTTRQVSAVPRDQWSSVRVGELMVRCTQENTIGSKEDAMRALSIMQRTGNTRLMVVDGGRLVGIIALKDLLKFFALKVDLEGLS